MSSGWSSISFASLLKDLSAFLAILFKHTMEKFQFSWEVPLVTDSHGSAYQYGQHKMFILQMVL